MLLLIFMIKVCDKIPFVALYYFTSNLNSSGRQYSTRGFLMLYMMNKFHDELTTIVYCYSG